MLVNYKFKDGSESLSSHTGLALVGALLERTDLKGRLSAVELHTNPAVNFQVR